LKRIKYSISIIIPIFNLASKDSLSYFNDLIQSICINILPDQKYLIHELIIIDDSPNLTNKPAIKDILKPLLDLTTLKYYRNIKNEGQAFSRNRGATYANGDYLHFIDQDDLLCSEFYKFLIFDNKSADLLMADCVHLSNKNKSYYRYLTKYLLKRANSIVQLRFLLFNNIANSPGQYIIKKSTFLSVNGFPLLINRGSDDFGFFLRLIKIKHKFIFKNKSKFAYRTHSQQSSKSLNMENSEINAFEDYSYNISDILYWVKIIKLNKKFSLIRKLLYKVFYASF